MRTFRAVVGTVAVLSLWSPVAIAADLAELAAKLKQGGYVLVIRHVATDDSQKDVYPFLFDDMTKQRQLSERGRQVAREMGSAIKTMGIPIGKIYASKLNRAIETGTIISGAQVIPTNELTDSGAGSISAMANPSGSNVKIGSAIRGLVNEAPPPATNIMLITHKTNIADAFGKNFSDVREGEALVYKPNATGNPTLVGRVQAGEWKAQAESSR